jgi:hypothetical protein
MTMTLIMLVIVGLSGYLWMTRGFFSALINLVAVFCGGAIGFGLWEPMSYWLLASAGGGGGFFTQLLADTAWGLGLAIPFAVGTAIVRVGLDAALRANVGVTTVTDYIGGGVCGVAAGIILSGITTISIGFFRLPTDMGFLGYQPLGYAAKGSVVRQAGLWDFVATDKLTVGMYSMMSTSTLNVGEPMAKWYPDLHLVPTSLRMGFSDGKARNTMLPKDFKILSRYSVKAEAGASAKPAPKPTPAAEGAEGTETETAPPPAKLTLFNDTWDPREQQVVDIDDKPFPPGSRIEGVVIQFEPGAREKSGQVVLGNGQVRMILHKASTGESMTAFPFAVVARAQADKTEYVRFRYDSQNIHMASVGADAQPRFGFEFMVPPEFEPIAVYVKNIRQTFAADVKKRDFAGASSRDSAVGSMMGGATLTNLDESKAKTIGRGSDRPISMNNTTIDGFRASNQFVNGWVIRSGQEPGEMTLVPQQRGMAIREGKGAFTPADLKANRAIEPNLRCDRFEVDSGFVIVQVDLGLEQLNKGGASLLGDAAADAKPDDRIALVDANGEAFPAVGYIYEDDTKVEFRYTLGRPLVGTSDLPDQLSKSRPEQKLTLVFSVSKNVVISKLAIGNSVIAKYAPPLTIDSNQK